MLVMNTASPHSLPTPTPVLRLESLGHPGDGAKHIQWEALSPLVKPLQKHPHRNSQGCVSKAVSSKSKQVNNEC